MDLIQRRRSPVHDMLEAYRPYWSHVGGSLIARRVHDASIEAGLLDTVALCDFSSLPKLGLKGSGAAQWLGQKNVTVPSQSCDTAPLAGGGLVVCTGPDEFFLEDGFAGCEVARLRDGPDAVGGESWRVERQDGGFALAGAGALGVMAQTCGVDLAEALPDRLLMTRVAGVSCSILPRTDGGSLVYRLWVDASFAVYLWEQLVQISGDLGGGVVGVDCIAPGVLEKHAE